MKKGEKQVNIELPEALWRQISVRAAELGKLKKDVVGAGLMLALEADTASLNKAIKAKNRV